MRALLPIAVAAEAGRRVQAGCGLFAASPCSGSRGRSIPRWTARPDRTHSVIPVPREAGRPGAGVMHVAPAGPGL